MKFTKILSVILIVVSLLNGCNSQENAKKQLEQKGVIYSHQSFFNAIEQGNKEYVALFIKAGIDLNTKDHNGYTPLIIACKAKHKDIIELFISKDNVNEKDPRGNTVLHHAVRDGDKTIVEFIISKGADVNAKDDNGSTPLHNATERGYKDIVELLISKGADTSLQNGDK